MPPSSAQYTVSVVTDVEASMLVSSRGTREAKVVPTPRRVGTLPGSNSWPFAAPGGRVKEIIEKRKSLPSPIPGMRGLSLQSEDQAPVANPDSTRKSQVFGASASHFALDVVHRAEPENPM